MHDAIESIDIPREVKMHTQERSLFIDWPLSLLAVAMTSLLCLGCGAGSKLTPVEGVVQFEGKPMTGGTVLLLPRGEGDSAVGEILEQGGFQLTTLKTDGVVPGSYKVTIVSDLKLRGKEVHATCIAPSNFVLEVEAGKENYFDINVSKANGWKLSVDD